MASYGQALNSGYDPIKDNIYPLFTQYFENPRMTKIKDTDSYSMYMSKIHALLGVEFRYLITFVPGNNFPIGDTKFLTELEWESLQTRTLIDDHKLPFHSYTPVRIRDLDRRITLVESDDFHYTYKVENLPIQIILLATKKGLNYNSSGTVVPALETYQTLINFI